MNKAFSLFFWGYIFVFFRLHIGIDILAAPIGYYLIYSGARLLSERFPTAKKVELTAFIGILISVPGVFVNLSEVVDVAWTAYAEGLFIWKVIVVYYLLATFKSMAQKQGHSYIRNRIKLVNIWYMAIHLLLIILTAISLNFENDAFSTFYIIVSIAVIAMDIMLLLLFVSLRKVDWREHKTNETPL